MFNVTGYLHVGMLPLGPWVYRVLTFALMFLTGIFLSRIIKRFDSIDDHTRIVIVIVFLLFPFNAARVALIDFPYTLCNFFFFLAWYLIDKSKLVSLFLFFISFTTNSLLVFYALPMLYVFYISGGFGSLKRFVLTARSYAAFIISPFLYFYVKTSSFQPYGYYSGYNENFDFAFIIPTLELQAIEASQYFRLNFFFAMALVPVVAVLMSRLGLKSRLADHDFLRSLSLGFWGLISVLLAGFPYWILGLVPTFSEWTSRYQLLFPLGAALIVSGLISSVRLSWLKVGVVSVIIGGCISFWVSQYYFFFVDWNKQQQLVAQLKKIGETNLSSLIVVNDETLSHNAINRKYRFYEWNCMMKQAIGSERGFAINSSELPAYATGRFDSFFSSHYCASGHVRADVFSAIHVRINYANEGRSANLLSFESPMKKITISIEMPSK